MKWKYHRNKRLKVSKWVYGNSWVTKFDHQPGRVHYGLLGEPQGIMNYSPQEMREQILMELFGKSP